MRIELTTLGLLDPRSNQLSYEGIAKKWLMLLQKLSTLIKKWASKISGLCNIASICSASISVMWYLWVGLVFRNLEPFVLSGTSEALVQQ